MDIFYGFLTHFSPLLPTFWVFLGTFLSINSLERGLFYPCLQTQLMLLPRLTGNKRQRGLTALVTVVVVLTVVEVRGTGG